MECLNPRKCKAHQIKKTVLKFKVTYLVWQLCGCRSFAASPKKPDAVPSGTCHVRSASPTDRLSSWGHHCCCSRSLSRARSSGDHPVSWWWRFRRRCPTSWWQWRERTPRLDQQPPPESCSLNNKREESKANISSSQVPGKLLWNTSWPGQEILNSSAVHEAAWELQNEFFGLRIKKTDFTCFYFKVNYTLKTDKNPACKTI